MKKTKKSIETRVYGRICAGTPSRVWVVGDFPDFGSHAAVSKALQRLEEAKRLRRIEPGLYDRPRLNRLTGKPAVADYRAVIEAIARRDQARILVDGMTAANDLGLSDAVPGRVIIHSDVRLRPIHLGSLTITFRLTSASKLYWAGRPAMRIVQALHWLKPKLSYAEDGERIERRIKSLLSDPKQGAALRKDIKMGLPSLPAWMQDFLGSLLSKNFSVSKSLTKKNSRSKRDKASTT